MNDDSPTTDILDFLPPVDPNENCEELCKNDSTLAGRKLRFVLATDSAAHMRKKKKTNEWLRVEGIDLLQRDLKSLTRIDHVECQKECEATPECESFSHTGAHPHGFCYLKKSAENYRLNSDVNSYVKIPAKYKCSANADVYGDDFFATKTSYNGCAKLCNKQRKKCDSFTWILNENEPLGQCYLKTLIDEPRISPNARGSITCQRGGGIKTSCLCFK